MTCSKLEFTFFLGPWAVALTRFRLLITSVFRLIGRGRPCSLRNKPHALQSTEPASSRRQRGVVLVEQFWHTGCNVFVVLLATATMLWTKRRLKLIINCDQIDKEFSRKFEARTGKLKQKLTGALAEAPPGVADIV